MADMHAAVAQNPLLLFIQPHAVRQNQAFVRQSQMIQVDDIAHAGHRLDNFDLSLILRSMGMHLDAVVRREVAHLFQQRLGTGNDKPW
ncbi:hypothetical protein D3C73_1455390 [compost metagenome]